MVRNKSIEFISKILNKILTKAISQINMIQSSKKYFSTDDKPNSNLLLQMLKSKDLAMIKRAL